MKINIKKMKAMKISRTGEENINIILDGQPIEQMKRFKYLEAHITSDGRCKEEIRTRISIAKKAFTRRK